MPELYNKENLSQCCGCTACFAECPVGAITMVCDDEGFKYPSVNTEKCIECNACMRVCPLKKEGKNAGKKETNVFVALKNKEKDSQKIQGNNNIQARGNIHVTGGIDIYEQTDDKRR